MKHPIAQSTSLCSLLVVSLALALGGDRSAHAEEGRTIVIDEREGEDSASSTSVIARDQMQDALSDLGEVLDRQAGMRITRLGGLGSFTRTSIRGSTGEQVLLLLEGVPLVGTEGGPFDLGTLPLGLLSRITLTRGTSPAAFGSSAIGGVVDLRLREARGLMSEVEVGGGSFDSRSARAFLGLGDGESGAALALDYQGSAGDFPYRHGGGTAFDDEDGAMSLRENNASDSLSGLLRGRIVFREGLSAQLFNVTSWRRREVPGIAIYEGGWATMETLMNTLGSRLDVALDWTKGATLSLLPWMTYSQSGLEVSEGGLSLGGGSSEAWSLNGGARLNLNLPFTLDEGADWVLTPSVTLAYRHETYTGEGVVDAPPSASRHRLAAATQLKLDAKPIKVELLVDARFEGAWSGAGDEAARENAQGSARVGLAHFPSEGTRLRLNLSQGARFPTPFELFGFTAMTRGNAALTPEHGLTLDGGVSHDATWLPSGSYGAIELSAYASWTSDLIQFVRNSQGVSRPENIAEAFIGGVELGLWLDLFAHVRMRGTLSWCHSEDRSDIAARKGKKLPYRPTWKSYLRLAAYAQIEGAGEAGLALELEHLEGDVLDHANLIENPPRIIFGLASWVELLEGEIRLSLNLRNIGDAKVLDFQGYPLPGPTVMATLRWRPALD